MNTEKGWVVVILGLALLTGCASDPRQVNCDRHLEPINLPAPKTPQSAAVGGSGSSSPGQAAP